MKKILIASYDMEVGGVERSLISMLEHFDYDKFQVDLMLFRHQGDFMSQIPRKVNLLKEISEYTTFRKSMKELIKDKQFRISFARMRAKLSAEFSGKLSRIQEPGYYQMQLMWKHAMKLLPDLDKEYDVAISYLWPHYFVADKVQATKKIAWIHTDYSNIETDIEEDQSIWMKFDHIISVSDSCKTSFLKKYNFLEDKVCVMENITSPEFIKKMSINEVSNPLTKDKRFKIVTVARLSHAKGLDNAVRALKLFRDRSGTDAVWYIIGYGGDEKKLLKLIEELDLSESFILLGKKINPYPFVRAADLYVQPSRYEGKSVTVIEAQILSKPVMITNYSTSSSQVKNGYDGLICELSINGIVEGLEVLSENSELRENLSLNCRKTNYSNSRELENLYQLMG
ncbi:glycosyl transferase [Salipaludibacillus keqinensis]|uniref:Glycosyl transferase n=1 Tax=Salipaludibacillus keqinensis TaxID=2045207 RepID=A0A323TM23_9BACI|nr:glycosyltransferase [Salipaludibacillus keqinensis]PYZ95076.1 glycosyl transferase [Salipaludibacillus keqinensis]